jgi:hypothetical protein
MHLRRPLTAVLVSHAMLRLAALERARTLANDRATATGRTVDIALS